MQKNGRVNEGDLKRESQKVLEYRGRVAVFILLNNHHLQVQPILHGIMSTVALKSSSAMKHQYIG